MKKGPDLVTVVVMAFIVGTLATGIFSQTDFQFYNIVAQVFDRAG
ncbi:MULTISPECIES: hypothetical protein [Neptunomonas]|nr:MULTISPECIES: hypothetical protein [Neptunomonas]